jgi:ADP-ribose pyrophosphatase
MPQVLILPVVEDKWLVLARVYRPVICDATWELPAGGADANESPVEAARRELSEETGIQIVDLNRFQIRPPLVHMPRSPYLPFIFTVLLTEQEFEERGIYDSEVQEAGRFAFSEVLEKIVAGEIYVGLHIAVMMKFLLCHGTEALRKWQLSCIPAR